MPSTDAATSTPVPPRTAVRLTGLAGRLAPPPNRVSADSGTSTPISNRVSLLARLRGLQRTFLVRWSRRCCSRRRTHRGRPVTTRPTPPVTGPPLPPPRPPPLPPPGPPPPPLPLPLPPPVVQVTTCGSQEKVGQGVGFPPWSPPRPPSGPPWSCFLGFLPTSRRFGGTWFQVWPVKTGVGNGSTPSGTNMFSA